MTSLSSVHQAPIPLGAPPLPMWPEGIFPRELELFIRELARSTETPIELASLTCFSMLSAATHRKFRVRVRSDYFEPLNIWTSVALQSGSRKSAVFNTLVDPLSLWERQKKKEMAPLIARKLSERKTIEIKVKELRRQAAIAEGHEFDELSSSITELEAEIDEKHSVPQIWTADVTAETLAVLMEENRERMAILSDEAGIFDIIAGRYSGGIPNLDIFLQGHSGSPSRVNRKGKPPIFLDKTTLTVGLVPQPEILRGLTKNPLFRGRGLLARFLYAMPPSNLGCRTHDGAPVSSSSLNHYRELIQALLDRESDEKVIMISDEAYADWHAYRIAIEVKMGKGGPLHFLTDWASKLPGAIVRLAGLLHIARHAFGDPELIPISQDDMKSAIRLGHVLIEHAKVAFDMMGADPAMEGARVVLDWINRTQPERFTFRDCHYALKGRFKRAKDLNPAIDVLLERHYIYEKELVEKKPYRPSRVFLVNMQEFLKCD